MKRIVAMVTISAMILLLVGCMAHTHVIGNGGGQGASMQARQWYVLWGLVPINSVDTKAMSGGAQDYTIKTSISPVDFFINIFTSMVTVYSRTVSVTK